MFQAPGYPIEEASGKFKYCFDMFCVGVTLFEMATGQMPDLSLEHDALLATINDPLKRELIIRFASR